MMQTKSIKLTSVAQIGLHCVNFPASYAFYHQLLGLPVLYDASPKLAIFELENIQLMLSAESEYLPSQSQNSPIIYFNVDDMFAAYQHLSDKGIEFDSSPRCTSKIAGVSVWQAFLRDPDGHLLGLQSTV